MSDMKFADYLGRKLTDIIIDEEEDQMILEFTGKHRLIIEREGLATYLRKRPHQTAEEAEEQKKSIAKARREAKADAKAKADKKTTKATTTRKKSTTSKTSAKK